MTIAPFYRWGTSRWPRQQGFERAQQTLIWRGALWVGALRPRGQKHLNRVLGAPLGKLGRGEQDSS